MDQLSCRQTGNCPSNEGISNETLTNCTGHLKQIENPKPVIFPYTASDQLQLLPHANISAVNYFKNDDP